MGVRFKAPIANNGALVVHRDPQQAELPDSTELNYDVQPRRVLRQFRWGLAHMAGLSEWGMPQTLGGFSAAFLPPPVSLQPMQAGARGIRNIGGAYGQGRPSAGTLHIPSVLVPKTVG